jgi:hypothetical protein
MSLRADDPTLMVAADVAGTLLGAPAEVEHLRGGGRNSRIYRVTSERGTFALKQYPSRQDEPRDRLGTEVGALELMAQPGVAVVPRVIAVDRERNFALLTWIEGVAVPEASDADIDAAAAFLASVHALRRAPEAVRQPPAAEACLSGVEIERQVRARIKLLTGLPADDGELHAFLDGEFVPAFERFLASAVTRIGATGLDFAAELPQERRSLVPSDFGFHNSLRRDDKSLIFIDFEYFGWDDPVKLTADILLHPGISLGTSQQQRFRAAAEKLYGEDAAFAPRLAAFLPLFGARWVLILLNEFIPDRWQRRLLAGATESWGEAKTRQLRKARDLLARLS